jgi:hypothetical protein
MTNEELDNLVDEEGVDKVIAALVRKGYYVAQSVKQSVLPGANMVVGSLALLDPHGVPAAGLRVAIEMSSPYKVEANNKTYHLTSSRMSTVIILDELGEASIPLVVASKVTFNIEGSFFREITIPAQDFNIFEESLSDNDRFSNPKPAYVPAIRRS